MSETVNNSDLEQRAFEAFRECSELLLGQNLAVELRPRVRDRETVFSGDFDYLMDRSNFEKIVTLYFEVCLRHQVSFQLLQRSDFVKRLVIHGRDGRKIISEFWPHVELATRPGCRGWSFISSDQFASSCDAGFKQETLALIFVTHLSFKKKDPADHLNRWRLEEFVKRMEEIMSENGSGGSLTSEVRDLLKGIIQGEISLEEGNQTALGLLANEQIKPVGCVSASLFRAKRKVGRLFKGWGGRVIPCAGPDGSGKSYFMDAVLELAKERSLKMTSMPFRHLFRKSRIYRFVNRRYRSGKGKGLERVVIDERLAPMIFWLALPRYCWRILMSFKVSAFLMDRFFLEFMVRGYREENEKGFVEIPGYSLRCRLLPEPRTMIILAADYELMTSRKAELDRESADDLYRRYIAYGVGQGIRNVIFLNTHESGEDLAERCLTLAKV